MAPPLQILISGGGIAGPCLAYWLLKTKVPVQITILERAAQPRTSGQAVDIRDAAVEVIQRMGLEQAIRDLGTTEQGMDAVYLDGITKASFPATGDTKHQTFTSEFEILRGDLSGIFLDATRGNEKVEYVFDEYLVDVQQEKEGGKVRVRFANRLPEREFDLVVGADGMMSKTRRLVWGHGADGGNYLRRLGMYMSFFTIPKEKGDTRFGQWYSTDRGRLAITRPSRFNDTRGFLSVADSRLSRFKGIEKAMKEGPEKQKEWLAKEFERAGWITPRLVREMMKTDDFYIQEIAQVKMGAEGWVKGRVALLGDSAFCPSPISGMGTSLALVGAYILAGEISQSPDNVPRALRNYQDSVRPFVDQCQKLIPGMPHLFFPQSAWGVWFINRFTSVISNSWAQWAGGIVAGLLPIAFSGQSWPLPKYADFE